MKIMNIVGLLMLATTAGTASATVIGFDFENEAAATHAAPHSITRSGLTIGIGQGGPAEFRFYDASAGGAVPAGFGNRSLQSLNEAGFVIDFSEAVSAVSVDFSDFGVDADMGTLFAFGASGLLAMDMVTLAGGTVGVLTWDTLSVAAAGITSINIMASSDALSHNSVFWDNLRLTVNRVPEPLTPALMLVGLGLLGVQRRISRKAPGGRIEAPPLAAGGAHQD